MRKKKDKAYVLSKYRDEDFLMKFSVLASDFIPVGDPCVSGPFP